MQKQNKQENIVEVNLKSLKKIFNESINKNESECVNNVITKIIFS